MFIYCVFYSRVVCCTADQSAGYPINPSGGEGQVKGMWVWRSGFHENGGGPGLGEQNKWFIFSWKAAKEKKFRRFDKKKGWKKKMREGKWMNMIVLCPFRNWGKKIWWWYLFWGAQWREAWCVAGQCLLGAISTSQYWTYYIESRRISRWSSFVTT